MFLFMIINYINNMNLCLPFTKNGFLEKETDKSLKLGNLYYGLYCLLNEYVTLSEFHIPINYGLDEKEKKPIINKLKAKKAKYIKYDFLKTNNRETIIMFYEKNKLFGLLYKWIALNYSITKILDPVLYILYFINGYKDKNIYGAFKFKFTNKLGKIKYPQEYKKIENRADISNFEKYKLKVDLLNKKKYYETFNKMYMKLKRDGADILKKEIKNPKFKDFCNTEIIYSF